MYDELIKRLKSEADSPYNNNRNLMRKAADAIEELLAERDEVNADSWKTAFEVERDEHRWIPVTERLPEQGKRYLVIRFDEVTKTQFIGILWHDAHDLWWNRLYKGQYNITHWMPLPEPPRSEP